MGVVKPMHPTHCVTEKQGVGASTSHLDDPPVHKTGHQCGDKTLLSLKIVVSCSCFNSACVWSKSVD